MAQSLRKFLNSKGFKLYGYSAPARFMCSNARGLDVVNDSQPGVDFLLQNLRNATNTRKVLDMVSTHNNIMNNKHVMQALRSVFTLQKHGESNYSTKEILSHPDFSRLCQRLKFQAATIELNEIIEALKVVCYVGAPSNSIIVQVLLQIIKHHVNDLSLQQILFVDFLLSQLRRTPLMEALQIALPMVFKIQLPLKMEYDNASHLSEYLFYATRYKLGNDSVDRIVDALMKHQGEFGSKVSKSIIWSICDMDYDFSLHPLMDRALNSLVIHLEEISYTDMETTLSKLSIRYKRKFSYFYNQVFFDACANQVIEKDLGFKHSLYILRKFIRVCHVNDQLLDYMTNKAIENPEFITKGDLADIYTIVLSVSSTDYRPKKWKDLKNLIADKNSNYQIADKKFNWIKFGSALCLLDIHRTDLLDRCLDGNYIRTLIKRRHASDFENFAIIWQCINEHRPDLTYLLPSKFLPENVLLVNELKSFVEFPLETALYKAFGGEKYVRTSIYSKLGYHIDHVMVFRKGGLPVAMNHSDNVVFVEDLRLPADHQLVIIQCLHPVHYTLNDGKLKYPYGFILRSLEARGYPVVTISSEVWRSLPDFEKIPYIVQAIKEKVEDDEEFSENVI